MHHNLPGNLYWGRLYTDFPDFQVRAFSTGMTSSRRRTRLPVPWDGSVEGLLSGWDEGFVRG